MSARGWARQATYGVYDVHHVVGLGRFQRDNRVKLRNQAVTLSRKEADGVNMRKCCYLLCRGSWNGTGETCHGNWTGFVPAGRAKSSPKNHSFVATTSHCT